MSDKQAIGAVGGGIIGFFIGGPLGAVKGATLGYSIGTSFDTTELDATEGPRIDDLTIQTSKYGEYIPRVHNTDRLTGNVFWVDGNQIHETKHTEDVEQGGKGGGGSKQSVTTYSYSVTMAIMICEGPITGIRKIWADNTLIYNMGNASDLSSTAKSLESTDDMEIFLGTADQLPSVTIELEKGIGATPAFRGSAYVVFTNLALEDYGNRIPNLSFEVIDNEYVDTTPVLITHYYLPSGMSDPDLDFYPTGDETKIDSATLPWYYENGVLNFMRWGVTQPGETEGINGLNYARIPQLPGSAPLALENMPYNYFVSKSMDDFTTVLAAERFDSYPWDLPGSIDNYKSLFIRPVDNGPGMFLTTHFASNPGNRILSLGLRLRSGSIRYVGFPETGVSDIQESVLVSHRDGLIYLSRPDTGSLFPTIPGSLFAFDMSSVDWTLSTDYFTVFDNNSYLDDLLVIEGVLPPLNAEAFSWGLDPYSTAFYRIRETAALLESFDTRLIQIGVGIDITSLLVGYTDLGKRFVVRDNIIYLSHKKTSNSHYVLRKWVVESGTVTQELEFDIGVNKYMEFNHSIVDIHPNMFAYAHNGSVTSQGTLGVNRSTGMFLLTPALDNFTEITVPDAVGAEMDRIDVLTASDYDTSGLNADIVDGYTVSRPSPISSALKPLQQVFRFDVFEADYQIKFVTRGTKTSAVTLTPDDIRAHEVGSKAPPQAVHSYGNPNAVPGRIEITYKSKDREYEEGFAIADRLTLEREAITKLSVPLVMSADNAYKTADILLLDTERESKGVYEIVVPFKYSHLERTDIITLGTDNETSLNLRIIEIEKGAPGLVKIKSVLESAGDYTSNAVGDSGTFTDGAILSEPSAQLFFLDIPQLRTADNDPGLYWGMTTRGNATTWRGGAIYQSKDKGVSWNMADTALNPMKHGIAINKLSEDTFTIFTYNQELNINMINGIPETKTETQVRAGANLVAYGRPGNWEIIKFTTSTLVSGTEYNLGGLLRGQYGTDWVMKFHQEGDFVVLLDAGDIHRMQMTTDNYSLTYRYLAITLSTAFDDRFGVDAYSNGTALKPHAPTHVKGIRQSNDDLVITWIPRGRYGFDWKNGVGQTVTDSQVFTVIILDNEISKRQITSAPGVNSVDYSADDQLIDFGVLFTDIDILVFAIDNVVGNGIKREATIISK